MARLLSGSATLSGLAHSSAGATGGISDGNHLEANANVADNDFLRVDGTEIEGRSASETLSDIGAAAIGANSDITSITGLTTDLAVAHGGTGASTLTANYALLGNGTSAPQMIAPSTDGNVLTSTGSTWQSEAPGETATCWINYDAQADSIRDSFNVSSVNSTGFPDGEHIINFGTGMSNANYVVSTAIGFVASGTGPNSALNVYRYSSSGNESAPSTGGFRFGCANNSGVSADMKYVMLVVFGGV